MHHKLTKVYPRYITQYLIPVVASLLCFYHKISGYVECAIRRTLIVHFGCRQYFEMRKNELLISPSDLEHIAIVCRDCRWKGQQVYDGKQEEWVW